MLKNGQTCFKKLAVFTLQSFKSMFGHFSNFCMRGLKKVKLNASYNYKVISKYDNTLDIVIMQLTDINK